MVLRIAGKNVDIGQALRTRIDETVTQPPCRNISIGGYSGQVTVSKSGRVFETELVAASRYRRRSSKRRARTPTRI